MGNINVGRWIIGGVIATVVLFVVDFVLNVMILGQEWNQAMTAMGKPPMTAGHVILFAILNLVGGLTALWIYVGIRPRFGAGITTAVYAGIAVWVIGYMVPYVFMMILALLPAGLLWAGLIVGTIQVPMATVAGAYFYQE